VRSTPLTEGSQDQRGSPVACVRTPLSRTPFRRHHPRGPIATTTEAAVDHGSCLCVDVAVVEVVAADVDGDRVGADIRVAAGLTYKRVAQRDAADEQSRLPRRWLRGGRRLV
jgi:hypothetical protein